MSFKMLDGELHADRVPLATIANTAGTPAYVYSATQLRAKAQQFKAALAPIEQKQLMFAVKANPHPAVLRTLADLGFGADIVSGGMAIASTSCRRPYPRTQFGHTACRDGWLQQIEMPDDVRVHKAPGKPKPSAGRRKSFFNPY